MGDLARTNPALKQLGLPPVGRAARGHMLLTKTLLIVGQEGNTQRESIIQREASADPGAVKVPDFEIHDPKLIAYDKATGKVVGEVALPRNATGAPMTYMINGKQYHRRPDRWVQSPCGTHRVVPALTEGACTTWPMASKDSRPRRLATARALAATYQMEHPATRTEQLAWLPLSIMTSTAAPPDRTVANSLPRGWGWPRHRYWLTSLLVTHLSSSGGSHGNPKKWHSTFQERAGRLVHRYGPHRPAIPGTRAGTSGRCQRHVRARGPDRVAHPPTGADADRHGRLRSGRSARAAQSRRSIPAT